MAEHIFDFVAGAGYLGQVGDPQGGSNFFSIIWQFVIKIPLLKLNFKRCLFFIFSFEAPFEVPWGRVVSVIL